MKIIPNHSANEIRFIRRASGVLLMEIQREIGCPVTSKFLKMEKEADITIFNGLKRLIPQKQFIKLRKLFAESRYYDNK